MSRDLSPENNEPDSSVDREETITAWGIHDGKEYILVRRDRGVTMRSSSGEFQCAVTTDDFQKHASIITGGPHQIGIQFKGAKIPSILLPSDFIGRLIRWFGNLDKRFIRQSIFKAGLVHVGILLICMLVGWRMLSNSEVDVESGLAVTLLYGSVGSISLGALMLLVGRHLQVLVVVGCLTFVAAAGFSVLAIMGEGWPNIFAAIVCLSSATDSIRRNRLFRGWLSSTD